MRKLATIKILILYHYAVEYPVLVSLKELQLLIVLNVLTTLYQDVNLTDVQDEKIPKFRRKTLSTALKENIDKIWALLDSTLAVS